MIELNGHKIKPTIFPDGTSQVWQLPEDILHDWMSYGVTWWFENETELIHLTQLAMLLNTHGKPRTLKMPYLPYARQDKQVSNNETFALSAFMRLLSTMGWNYITAHDIHGDMSYRTPTINNIPPDLSWITDEHYDTVIFPDASAKKRYGNIVPHKNQLCAKKVRDQSTGHITHYSLITSGYTSITGPCIVVDDLCDGGATFNILADSIPDIELDLYVTHGIFSKGLRELLKNYRRIYTTNSYFGADVTSHDIHEYGVPQAVINAQSISYDSEMQYTDMLRYVQNGRLVIEEIK